MAPRFNVVLPANLSSIVSSYAVNDQVIWLAGILPGGRDDDPLLIYSEDSGTSWRSVQRNDPLLARLPNRWLEGKKRVAQNLRPLIEIPASLPERSQF